MFPEHFCKDTATTGYDYRRYASELPSGAWLGVKRQSARIAFFFFEGLTTFIDIVEVSQRRSHILHGIQTVVSFILNLNCQSIVWLCSLAISPGPSECEACGPWL